MLGLAKKVFGGGDKTPAPAAAATAPEAPPVAALAAATDPGATSIVETATGEVKFRTTWVVDTKRLPEKAGLLHPEKLPFKAGSRDGARLNWEFYLKKRDIGENSQVIGLYLRLETKIDGNLAAEAATILPKDEPRPLMASFTVSPLDPVTKQPRGNLVHPFKDFLNERAGLGLNKFRKVEELPDMVDGDGMLHLRLEFTLQGNTLQAANELSVKNCLKQIRDEFKNEDYRDVILKTSDEKELSAHRVVLGARSKFFKDEFDRIKIDRIGNHLNPMDKYEIAVDYPSNVMGIIICHSYNGYLSPAFLDPEKVPHELALSLLHAANHFNLQELHDFVLAHRPDMQNRMEAD